MIVVRDIFRLKFGKAREFKAAMAEGRKFLQPALGQDMRVLADLVADSYTFVLESTHESLSAWEASMASATNDEWRAWYQTVIPLVEEGRREIFTIVE